VIHLKISGWFFFGYFSPFLLHKKTWNFLSGKISDFFCVVKMEKKNKKNIKIFWMFLDG